MKAFFFFFHFMIKALDTKYLFPEIRNSQTKKILNYSWECIELDMQRDIHIHNKSYQIILFNFT